MKRPKYTVSWNNDGDEEFKGYDKYKDAETKFRELDKKDYECTLTNSEEPLSMYDFSDKLNKNLEATKKKIPSMDIKELIETWSDGYHPECLALALKKITENDDKYPKIAELFHKLQSELSDIAGVKMNFSERISNIFNFGKGEDLSGNKLIKSNTKMPFTFEFLKNKYNDEECIVIYSKGTDLDKVLKVDAGNEINIYSSDINIHKYLEDLYDELIKLPRLTKESLLQLLKKYGVDDDWVKNHL